jgi:hypothetical protein
VVVIGLQCGVLLVSTRCIELTTACTRFYAYLVRSPVSCLRSTPRVIVKKLTMSTLRSRTSRASAVSNVVYKSVTESWNLLLSRHDGSSTILYSTFVLLYGRAELHSLNNKLMRQRRVESLNSKSKKVRVVVR